jgi:hypothetical protein
MHYIIQLLAAILVGTAIGALLAPRTRSLFMGSIITIVVGVASFIMISWPLLAVGTAIFVAVQCVQREKHLARA